MSALPLEIEDHRSAISPIESKRIMVVSPDSSNNPVSGTKVNFKLNSSGLADLGNSEFQFGVEVPPEHMLAGSGKSCFSEVVFRNKNQEVIDRVQSQNVISRMVDTLSVDRNIREGMESLKSGSSRVGYGVPTGSQTYYFSVSLLSQFMSLRAVDLDLTGTISAELIVNSAEQALYRAEGSTASAAAITLKDPRWLVPISTFSPEAERAWAASRDSMGRSYEFLGYSVSQIPVQGTSSTDRLVVENSFSSLRGFLLVARKPTEISSTTGNSLRFVRPKKLDQIQVRLGNKNYEPVNGIAQELASTAYFMGKNWDSSIINQFTYQTDSSAALPLLDNAEKMLFAQYYKESPASWIFGYSFESADETPDIDVGNSSRGRLEITLSRSDGVSPADDLEYFVVLVHGTKWVVPAGNARQEIIT